MQHWLRIECRDDIVFGRLFKKKPAPLSSSSMEASVVAEGQAETSPTLAQTVAIGASHHQSGRFAEAEQIYRQVLKVEPDQFDALQLLGLLLHQKGESAAGAELVARAVSADPTNPAVCNNLGEIYRKLGRLVEAEAAFDMALASDPNFADAHYNVGILLHNQGQIVGARACYERALAIRPDFAVAHNRLGLAFAEERNLAAARACFIRALELTPERADVHLNLGNVQKDMGMLEEASASYRKAIALRPEFPEAINNLGSALRELGRLDEAIATFKSLVALRPEMVIAHSNLAAALNEKGDLEGCRAHCEQALLLDPESAEAHYNLGLALRDEGRTDEASAHFEQAIRLNPDYAEARWGRVMARLPSVASSQEEVENARAAFASGLAELDAWCTVERNVEETDTVGVMQPFLLAYQEADNRPLLAQYGELCCRLMRRWQERRGIAPPAPRRSPDRIRIGIVSAQIRDHSVWTAIVKGWFIHLDRARIDLLVFAPQSSADYETEFARSRATYFQMGKYSLQKWADLIVAQRPDILVYPEIGMDPTTFMLACLRLAPVQVASWGHPETTGLTTIDHYLSAEGLEPAGAQRYYTEKLVTLPNLGCSYQALGVPDAGEGLSLPFVKAGIPLLVCPGRPWKYAPGDDHVFIDIARLLGDCQFVFFCAPQLPAPTEKLHARLRLAFADAGLAFDRFVTFAPNLTRYEFFGLLKRADVFLDTIGFSGFNTAMQAIECTLPIVTIEGRFLRGRLASGILRRMGLSDLVANAPDEYVRLAVRLVRDAGYREEVRRRIAGARSVLFDDVASIEALQEFLARVAGQG